MEIRIYKSKLTLEVLVEGKALHSFPVGIGRTGAGHKVREGDGLTPEGEYAVCVKNPKSKYYLSLGLNYPSPEDAEAGLKRGQITRAEHDEIVEAHRTGKIPPWKTSLGGEVYIHGELEKQSWSQGCIRLNDPEMKLLYELTLIGTKVTIFP